MRNVRSTAVDVALAFARRNSALRRPSRRDHFQPPSDVAAEIVHARGRAAAVVIHGIVAVARRPPGGADKGSCLGSRHGASLFWPRLRRLTRKAAEVRGGLRSAGPGPEAFVGIPFRPGPTLRAIVIRERPAVGPVRTSPILAPDGRAGLASPGPGTHGSLRACRAADPHPTPYLWTTPGRHQMDETRPLTRPPPTSTPARPPPKAAKVAGLSALPIASRWSDYAAA